MNPLGYHASGYLRPIAGDAVPTNIIGVRGQDGAHADQNHLPGKLSGHLSHNASQFLQQFHYRTELLNQIECPTLTRIPLSQPPP